MPCRKRQGIQIGGQLRWGVVDDLSIPAITDSPDHGQIFSLPKGMAELQEGIFRLTPDRHIHFRLKPHGIVRREGNMGSSHGHRHILPQDLTSNLRRLEGLVSKLRQGGNPHNIRRCLFNPFSQTVPGKALHRRIQDLHRDPVPLQHGREIDQPQSRKRFLGGKPLWGKD